MTAKKLSTKRSRSRTNPTVGDTIGSEVEPLSTLIATVSDLAARREPDFFQLADVLATAKQNHPEVFAEILSQARVSRRRAFYLLNVRERFQPFMRDAMRLQMIGWTKLKVLAPFMTTANADELLVKAETMSAHKLGQVLRDEEAPVASHCVLLHLTPEQYGRYEAAIRAHGGRPRGRQLVDQERALMAIIDRAVAPRD